jgi:hypothetical protein
MEVHHHSSNPSTIHRKKWTHYFWEFLMLFLAVFCGFLAEYQLEHKIEKDREKQFIRSMIEDLETDTSNLRVTIESFAQQDKYFDTIFHLFPQLVNGYNHLLRTSMINVMGWKNFVATDKTIQQLKYSGGMRLIKKRKMADAIAGYDALLRADELDMPQLDRAHDKVGDRLGEILDMQGLETALQTTSISELEKGNKNYLLKDDAVTLGQYYNDLTLYRFLRQYTVERMKNIKIRASALISILKDGYNIK